MTEDVASGGAGLVHLRYGKPGIFLLKVACGARDGRAVYMEQFQAWPVRCPVCEIKAAARLRALGMEGRMAIDRRPPGAKDGKAVKLAPKRLEFLRAALAQGGELYHSGALFFASPYWIAGSVRLTDQNAGWLRREGLIERVVLCDTQRTLKKGQWYVYRVTEAGRRAVAAADARPSSKTA